MLVLGEFLAQPQRILGNCEALGVSLGIIQRRLHEHLGAVVSLTVVHRSFVRLHTENFDLRVELHALPQWNWQLVTPNSPVLPNAGVVNSSPRTSNSLKVLYVSRLWIGASDQRKSGTF